jgi:hypothetical protein
MIEYDQHCVFKFENLRKYVFGENENYQIGPRRKHRKPE